MLTSLPVSSLKKYLSGILPLGWEHYETETILMELKSEYNPLLAEKINLIKVLMIKPELFYTDAIFFLHACEVFNNQETDFTTLPSVTSLEAAFAIVDMARCQDITPEQSMAFELGVRLAVKDILIEDGYSQAIWPFDLVGITGLAPGATTEDMANKEKAIKEYVSGTYSKSTN